MEVIVSQRLNDWIKNRVKDLTWKIDNERTNPSDYNNVFEDLRNHYLTRGEILSSNQYSENTIYGSIEANVLFRVWHDEIHFKNNFDFSLIGEIKTAFAQIAELPQDWYLEKLLIVSDVIAQAAYYLDTGEFTNSQLEFTIKTLGLTINGN